MSEVALALLSEAPTTATVWPPDEQKHIENTEIKDVEVSFTLLLGQIKRDVINDLRSAPWARLAQGYLLGIWVFSLLFIAIMIPLYLSVILPVPLQGLVTVPAITIRRIEKSPGCLPDDRFDVRDMTYNIFDIAGFFQVTHGFGELSFTQAKIIDVAWDILIGRIGQVILAFFEWRAVSTYIQSTMHKDPVTYNTFWTAFMDSQPSLLATWTLFRDFVSKPGTRSKLTMAFIILSMLFIIAFPTIASAMTGYRPNTEGFVQDHTGSWVPFRRFSVVAYTIHDGDRVGLNQDHVVPLLSSEARNQYMDKLSGRYSFRSWWFNMPDRSPTLLKIPDADELGAICSWSSLERTLEKGCELALQVSKYTRRYGFYGLSTDLEDLNGAKGTWWTDSRHIYGPPLNISAFYLPNPTRGMKSELELFGHNWVDPRTQLRPFSDPAKTAMVAEGTTTTYSVTYVQQSGRCQPQDTYQWGFSFLQAFTVSIVLLVWTIGTYLIWLSAHQTLKRRGEKEIPRKYAAAHVLVDEMRSEIGSVGLDSRSLTTQQLEQVMKLELHGGNVLTRNNHSALLLQEYRLVGALGTWVKGHKLWSFFLFLFSALIIPWALLGWYAIATGYLLVVCVHTGMIFALVIGKTEQSRLFFVWIGVILGTIGGITPLALTVLGVIPLGPPEGWPVYEYE